MELFFIIVAAIVFVFLLPVLIANAGGILKGGFSLICLIALVAFLAFAR